MSVTAAPLSPALSAALVRTAPPPALPVPPAFAPLLPEGLPRGQTVSLGGSTSLLYAVLAATSANGAWCALVDVTRGAPGAEAMADLGLALERTVVVRPPAHGWSRAGWVTAVGALVDAFDVVAVRPEQRPAPGDVERLAARTRSRGAVLVAYAADDRGWPKAAVHLQAQEAEWTGLATDGDGRLLRRRMTVTATRRGRQRTADLWLPTTAGAVEPQTSPGVPDAPALQVVS